MNKFSLNTIVTAIVFFIVVVVMLTVAFWMYPSIMSYFRQDPQDSDQKFYSSIQNAGEQFDNGDSASAMALFQQLVETAESSEQEGVAKLNLSVARLRSDKISATQMLKEVSVNPLYLPLTRSKAAYYALSGYFGVNDEAFAKEHIFTGALWENFAEAGSVRDSSLQALEFFAKISPTPEISSRLASYYAFMAVKTKATPEGEISAEIAGNWVTKANSSIEELKRSDQVRYGSFHYTELASTYQQTALALDQLFSIGWTEDKELVETAYQNSINALLDNGDVGTSADLYSRYFYADFLVRTSEEDRHADIQKILAPFESMLSSYNVAAYLYTRMQKSGTIPPEEIMAHPDNMLRLAAISPEFKNALIISGVDAALFQE